MRPRISIALLSEDGERTWQGLKALVGRLLRPVEDDCRTPRFEIVPAEPNVRLIVGANRWESTSPTHDRDKLLLWFYIARVISEPGGFVVFHYDGDKPWSERMKCQRCDKFARIARIGVARALQAKKVRPGIPRRLERLVECVPFYSMEAWLLQATDRAIALCREKHRGADVDKFKAWGADRTLLDEVAKPKAATCLRDHHNDDLGKHVPVKDVVQAGRSLTCFLWALHGCPELADALAFPD